MATSREDNKVLTEVGPGTPMGDLFRRYWIPALHAEELPENELPAGAGEAAVASGCWPSATPKAASA